MPRKTNTEQADVIQLKAPFFCDSLTVFERLFKWIRLTFLPIAYREVDPLSDI